MRWASRDGRIERVKLAESSSCSVERGGRPDLARSAKVNGCKGLPASRATSPSVTFFFLSLLSGIRSVLVADSRLVVLGPEKQEDLHQRLPIPIRFIATTKMRDDPLASCYGVSTFKCILSGPTRL